MYGPGYAVDDPARTNYVGNNLFLIYFCSIYYF